MPQQRNKVPMHNIDNKTEQYWFSIFKELAQEADFGTVEVSLTIKSGTITNIQQTKIKKNFNINP